jgi:hypothetical protein
VFIDNIYFYSEEGEVGGGTDIVLEPFNDSGSADGWMRLTDANSAEGSIAWIDGGGNDGGAIQFSGSNTTTDGKAYIFQKTFSALDFADATSVNLTFDVKAGGPLVGAALHLQTNIPGTGVTNNFDLQAQGINESTWTSFSFDFENVAANADNFTIQFNIASGAFVGAGGVVLVDNIHLSAEGGSTGSDEVIIDFENSLTGVTAAHFETGGSLLSNPSSGGINTSANVYEINYTNSNQWWGGVGFLFGNDILDDQATVYKAKFYSTVAPTNVLFEVEVNGGAPVGNVQTISTANEWVELTFTLTGVPSGINRILVRPDVGALSGTKPNTGSLFVDDITCISCTLGGGSTGGGEEPTTAAPTPPARTANQVKSLFSNAYTNRPVDTFSAVWDDSDVADVQIEGDDVKKYTFTNFAGIDFSNNKFDASAMTHFHMDIWTPNSIADKSFTIKNVDFGGGNAEAFNHILTVTQTANGAIPALATGEWVSIDVPISAFAGNTTRSDLAQMVISTNIGIVFIDNIYFYSEGEVEDQVALPLDFEFASETYTFSTFGGAAFEVAADPVDGGNNALKMTRPAGTDWWSGGTIALDVPVDATSGTFSMDVYSSIALGYVELKLEQTPGVETIMSTTHGGTGWETLDFNVSSGVVNGTPSAAVLVVVTPRITNDGGSASNPSSDEVYYFDNIQSGDGSGGSGELVNGDFEAGGEPWYTNYGDNTPEIRTEGNNSYFFANVESVGEAFTVNLSQVITLVQGTNYTLAFDASSDRARTIIAGIGLNEGDFRADVETVNLTTDTQRFTLNLTANTFGGANCRVLFDMGAALGVVVLDNVTLAVTTDEPQPEVSLPVTFEEAELDYELQDFGGNASMIVTDPTDATNKVVQSIKGSSETTSEVWAGTTVANVLGFVEAIPFTATETSMNVRVWSPVANIPILLKVEDVNDGGKSVETSVMITSANTWETLIFDFSNHSDGTPALNLSTSYTKASIFFNFGTGGSGQTYYWDDLAFGDDPVIELSDDATLSGIEIDNEPISFFSPSTLVYEWTLNAGITVAPTVTATATDSEAQVVITQASGVPGTASILVTAEDGITTKTYTVSFTSPPLSVDLFKDIKVYGIGNNHVRAEISERFIGAKMEIYNMDGRLIGQGMLTTESVDIPVKTTGIGIIRIQNERETLSFKIWIN